MVNKIKWYIFDFLERIILGYGKYKSGQLAMEKLVKDYKFDSVLDIGCGDGYASDFFTNHGKVVTAVDYARSMNFKDTMAQNVIVGDFNELTFENKYDCVWCAHCLEHQLNVQTFLEKVCGLVNEGGVLAITVPPLKNTIVGGHVSLWNAGLILYRLILAGCDCSDAAVCRYGYNISVIVKKKSINKLDFLCYDKGDIRALSAYWPKGIKMRHKEYDDSFYGWIRKYNW